MKKHLSKIWATQMRYRWSAIRHKHSPKELTPAQYNKYRHLIPNHNSQIITTAQQINNRFKYTNDSWDRLYDSIDTPASCVLRTFERPPLRDDCDGFHSALYWFVSNSRNYDCRLLTVVTNNIVDSHSLLLIKNRHSEYFYIDYTYQSQLSKTIPPLVNHIQQRRYDHRHTQIMYSELSFWNNKQWISVKNF